MDSNTQYLVALSCFYKFGPKRLTMLKNHFEDFESAFHSSTGSIVQAGIDTKLANEFSTWRQTFNLANVLKTIEQ